ncbi:MAG: glutamyl-tRNA reductase [Candidatus Thiosymbion ectosymbiont of Robbea hypermnestra]|nr:glutamyl-tRNA reductase [Candidatus Thiosymbion ectosymbiont of Robbea hypermnestra]
MAILAIGLNHNTAPVEIRERVAFGPDILVGALRGLTGLAPVREGLILSTCNRTELYCSLHPDAGGEQPVIDWLGRFHGLDPAHLLPYLYTRLDHAAVSHLLRVTSGLDSMVLGEPQILGQVKTAFRIARDSGATGKLLGRLFQNAFAVAKQIRTDTAIGNSPVSVAFAAVGLARQIFSDLSAQTALLIGAGETIELAARHLCRHKIGRIIVANRTVERAHGLAVRFGGSALALTAVADRLPEADILITSTASPLPILGKGTVERALRRRRHHPIFMVDIAMPRDIEPEVGELKDVYLYTLDDLRNLVLEGLHSRREAAGQAEEIVAFHTEEFLGWLRSLDAVTLIQDYRARVEQLRDQVLDKARRRLESGKPAEEVLGFLAHSLTNKILHQPSARLRQAGREGREELLEAANELLQLDGKAGSSAP